MIDTRAAWYRIVSGAPESLESETPASPRQSAVREARQKRLKRAPPKAPSADALLSTLDRGYRRADPTALPERPWGSPGVRNGVWIAVLVVGIVLGLVTSIGVETLAAALALVFVLVRILFTGWVAQVDRGLRDNEAVADEVSSVVREAKPGDGATPRRP